jgi:peptidoglycan/xylan/chitin deacetylase (PgdA/CDA1 family)
MVYLKQISGIGKVFYPSLLWKIPSKQKTLYLTFDDGPIPEITPQVLEILKDYGVKATFFCVGENINNHPEVYGQIIAEGHHTGNHTYNHIKGWETSTPDYLQNVFSAEEAMENQKHNFIGSDTFGKTSEFVEQQKLFRPPYGRITPFQITKLQKLGYKIVMWDVISGDFDAEISAGKCYENVVKNCSSGSIVVFHDNIKASEKLIEVLPRVLQYYKKKGFKFEAI